MNFHTQNKNRNKIKRDTGRYIFNGLNFNIKRRETSKATHPTIFCKRHWKESANDSFRDVFIQWMYTQTHTHTQREIWNHVLERKKLVKRFKLQQKVKKKKTQKVASFEGDDEKAQYASLKTSSFNDFLGETFP